MTEKSLSEVPPASSAAVRHRMSEQKKRNTTPELSLRSALHNSGLRYRVHLPVPGCPRRSIDIAFVRKKVAVFVDGCFWHGCPMHGHAPQCSTDWWSKKIERNQARDLETTQILTDAGWLVLRIWEHERPAAVVDNVRDALEKR
ncbi:MAG: very short patch repair endonuclease [Rhodocyclaceae bacterium]|nr:very short patch repair endonuclease [Rhodocyclaceae bacterium]